MSQAQRFTNALWLTLLAVACTGNGQQNAAPSGSGGDGSGSPGVVAGVAGGAGGALSLSGATAGGSLSAGAATSAGATSVAGSESGGGAGDAAMAGAATGAASGSASVAGAPNAGAGGAGGAPPVGSAWDSPDTGNPFLPGYFADPSIFYDDATSTFYVYATTDGNWIDYSAEPAVWHSKDFLHWQADKLSLPAAWPKQPLWAPSVIKHPSNGHYYLLYAIGNASAVGTYVAQSTSPLGPWTNASVGTTQATLPLYKQGEMFGSNDWFDAQFFVDTDAAVYMTFGGGGQVGVAKLSFAPNFLVSIDNSDTRMQNGSAHKFKQLTGLTNYLEGSCMFKSGARYFITYSNSACQNYNVQYAVGSSPVGPFTHVAGSIVQRDNVKHVLGPGHDSILQYGGSTYIVYHRQHYQYVDVKRQAAINRIDVSGDNLSLGVQNQAGVFAGAGALETLIAKARGAAELDLAHGKPTLASSESAYKGGVSGNISETFPAIAGFYAARFAVDSNLGTRWAPSTLPGNLVLDLGGDRALGRSETTFEYVQRAYRYRIDYLAQAEASSLQAAQASSAWHSYADRSSNTQTPSPITDVHPATARYLRLTVLGADLPVAPAETKTILQTDNADRVSVVEFRVFQSAARPALTQ